MTGKLTGFGYDPAKDQLLRLTDGSQELAAYHHSLDGTPQCPSPAAPSAGVRPTTWTKPDGPSPSRLGDILLSQTS